MDPIPIIAILSSGGSAFIVTLIATPLLGRFFRARHIIGVDLHKPDRPMIPEMCGLAIVAGLIVSTGLSLVLFPDSWKYYASFLTTVGIASLVGVRDDLKPLDPRVKPLLTALAAVPIILLGTYDPHPVFPLIGGTRLTLVYPLLVFLSVAVPANAVNMMNPFNGVMSGTCSLLAGTMTVILFALGRFPESAMALGLLGAVFAFHIYNRYPAKVFSGDSGDLAVGAAIGAVAILGRIEAVAMVALMPHIMNAFYLLSSVRGFRERREIKSRPIRVREDGILEAATDQTAPVTLTRMILAQGPLKEIEVIRLMQTLTGFACFLALVTFLMIAW